MIILGADPSLQVSCKRSRIKQRFKLECALRTETAISDTRDFGIGKLLHNRPLLRPVGFEANRRLLEIQSISHNCQIGIDAFDRICLPQTVSGQCASIPAFGKLRSMALFQALCLFM